MIDHTGLQVSDPIVSREFYDKALAPLGYKMMVQIPKEHTGGVAVFGYGVPPKADFWVGEGTPNAPRVHVAFRAETCKQVDEFYRAALAAGGKDNGSPKMPAANRSFALNLTHISIYVDLQIWNGTDALRATPSCCLPSSPSGPADGITATNYRGSLNLNPGRCIRFSCGCASEECWNLSGSRVPKKGGRRATRTVSLRRVWHSPVTR